MIVWFFGAAELEDDSGKFQQFLPQRETYLKKNGSDILFLSLQGAVGLGSGWLNIGWLIAFSSVGVSKIIHNSKFITNISQLCFLVSCSQRYDWLGIVKRNTRRKKKIAMK